MPDEEERTEKERVPRRMQSSEASDFVVSELIENSDAIAGVESYVAAGAMDAAGVSKTDRLTVDNFKRHIEDYGKQRAF